MINRLLHIFLCTWIILFMILSMQELFDILFISRSEQQSNNPKIEEMDCFSTTLYYKDCNINWIFSTLRFSFQNLYFMQTKEILLWILVRLVTFTNYTQSFYVSYFTFENFQMNYIRKLTSYCLHLYLDEETI